MEMSCVLMLEMCMYVYACKLSVTNVGGWHVRIQAPGAKQTLLLLELPWQLLGGSFWRLPGAKCIDRRPKTNEGKGGGGGA